MVADGLIDAFRIKRRSILSGEEQTELLREMRDLLRLIAEPELAKRDQALRSSLLEIVGRSNPKMKAVLIMDGTRTQAAIRKESSIDRGALSRLVKSLRAKGVISGDEKPKLLISVPPGVFESSDEEHE